MAMFETFGGAVTQPSFPGGVELTLSENTQLAWPIQFQNTVDVVYNYMDVLPTSGGFTLTMPDAELASSFQSVIINNPTAFTFTLNAYGGSLLLSFTPGTCRYFILIDNSTQAGTWRSFPFAAGGSSVTSINMTSSSNNVVIGGVPITSAGTITLALANDLLQLSTKGTDTGIACRTAANTWELRTVVGTADQINVTNAGGVAGNITISMPADVDIVTSLTAGLVKLQGVTVSCIFPDTDLLLAALGTGYVTVSAAGLKLDDGHPLIFMATNNINYTSFQAGNQSVNVELVWPTVAPTAGQVLGFGGGTDLEWFNVTPFSGSSTVNALAKYLNTSGTLQDSGAILDATNNLTGLRSATIGHIRIGDPLSASGTTIVTTGTDEDINLSPNGNGAVVSFGNFALADGKALSLFNPANSFSISFEAPALLANQAFTYPLVAPNINQLMVTTGFTSPYTYINTYLTSKLNILYNGGMNVWQRGTSFTNATYFLNSDNNYMADGWKLLSSGNNIVNVTKEAGPTALVEAASSNCLRMTVVTTGQKFGVCQIREAIESVDLRGNDVVLQFTGLASGGPTTVKMAIIGWTGAANSPTSDPISAWGATGVDPTLAASWAYQDTPSSLTLTGNFVTYTTGTIPIGNTVNNIGILIWCDTTVTNVNDHLDVTCVGLTKGFEFTPYYPDMPQYEWLRCKRIFQKDLPYSITPTTLTLSDRGTFIVSPINAMTTVPNNAYYAKVEFETEMTDAKLPTITTYPITTITNTDRISDDVGADLAADSAVPLEISNTGFVLRNESGGNIVTTGLFSGHWLADSGF